MLTNMFVEQLGIEKPTLPCVVVGEAIRDDRTADSGWVVTDQASSLPLKSKGKGNKGVEGYLGFQISMTGDGIAIPGNKEPLLHVFYWEDPCDFKDEYYAFFPYLHDDETPFEILHSRLMFWGDLANTAWNERGWTFSLRLTTLNSPEDLRKFVIAPAMALLRCEDVRKALPDSWLDETLVCYPTVASLAEE